MLDGVCVKLCNCDFLILTTPLITSMSKHVEWLCGRLVLEA
jgi:hypothetical protein